MRLIAVARGNILHLFQCLVFCLTQRKPYKWERDRCGYRVESESAGQHDRFQQREKVEVTGKFAAQLVAPEIARAAPRISLGNISPNNTHITGPHDTANATMYRFATVSPATAAM